MNISEINGRIKMPYEINGNSITFNNSLSLNLAAFERDDAVHIDICKSIYGCLVMGVIPGCATKYIAQIDIPARRYGATIIIDAETDEEQKTITVVPFSIESVTLTLLEVA